MSVYRPREQLQPFIDALHDPAAIVTDSRTLTAWNEAFRTICAIDPHEGLPLHEALQLDAPVELEEGCFEPDDHRMVCLQVIRERDRPVWLVVVETDHCVADEWLELVSLRVRTVVTLVCQGKSNKEIALELGISESTVKKHVARAMRAAGVTRRSHLCSN